MRKLGFKNFRRFKNLEQIRINGITFLVGRNNSGKSTLVKALLLLNNYFKSADTKIFNFGNNILEDANIVTYGRAKYFEAEENIISFTHEIQNYIVIIELTGEDDKTYATVNSLSIHDTEKEILFIFNPQSGFVKIIKNKLKVAPQSQNKNIELLDTELENIYKELEGLSGDKTSKEYIELVSRIEIIKTKKEFLVQETNGSNQKNNYESEFVLEDFVDTQLTLKEQLNSFLTQSEIEYKNEFNKIQKGDVSSDRFVHLRSLKEYGYNNIANSFIFFFELLKDDFIIYMGANPAKQSALFAIRDKNNALAQAIHEYKQLNILIGEEEHRFILKWMQIFEIGNNFSITMHAGESYEMKIQSKNGLIQIADKGMGSIQAMLLILRIACVIRKIKNIEANLEIRRSNNRWADLNSNIPLFLKTMLIIEEPELNLHPALQSKLAEMFLDVHLKFNIDFLVETHSEYLIRKTQLLVKENKFESKPNVNPFAVIYFDKDSTQWNINYREDGKFIEDFGKGFYDEATLLTLNLL